MDLECEIKLFIIIIIIIITEIKLFIIIIIYNIILEEQEADVLMMENYRILHKL